MKLKNYLIYFAVFVVPGFSLTSNAQDARVRDYGIKTGILNPGEYNAITI